LNFLVVWSIYVLEELTAGFSPGLSTFFNIPFDPKQLLPLIWRCQQAIDKATVLKRLSRIPK
jgi:hypothetical protein